MPKDEFDADELNLIKLAQKYIGEDNARTLLKLKSIPLAEWRRVSALQA